MEISLRPEGNSGANLPRGYERLTSLVRGLLLLSLAMLFSRKIRDAAMVTRFTYFVMSSEVETSLTICLQKN